jgi:predicted nicotinamide N-methyase
VSAGKDASLPYRDDTAKRTLLRLCERAGRLFPLHEMAVPIPGARRPYIIALPADPDGPLDQLAEWQAHVASGSASPGATGQSGAAAVARRAVARGDHLPYWSLLWPSGMALAEALLGAPDLLRGRRALELGCGLGITATAALQAGANLLAADCFSDALLFCRVNTLRNAARLPGTLLLDWRTAAGREACVAQGPFDVVLAADVLYEAEDEQPLFEVVPRLLAPGGVFALAEPGRRVSLSFVAAARERGWQDESTVYERVWPSEDKPVRVTVHRFRLGTGADAKSPVDLPSGRDIMLHGEW